MEIGSFEFGPLIDAPEAYVPQPLDWRDEWANLDSNPGLQVSMREWSASSVGWIIAVLFGVALTQDPAPTTLSVRVTRL